MQRAARPPEGTRIGQQRPGRPAGLFRPADPRSQHRYGRNGRQDHPGNILSGGLGGGRGGHGGGWPSTTYGGSPGGGGDGGWPGGGAGSRPCCGWRWTGRGRRRQRAPPAPGVRGPDATFLSRPPTAAPQEGARRVHLLRDSSRSNGQFRCHPQAVQTGRGRPGRPRPGEVSPSDAGQITPRVSRAAWPQDSRRRRPAQPAPGSSHRSRTVTA